MGFVQDLKDGKDGWLKISLPDWEENYDSGSASVLNDTKNHVKWVVERLDGIMTFETGTQKELELLEQVAIVAQKSAEAYALKKGRARSSVNWESIEDCEIVEIKGGEALYINRWLCKLEDEKIAMGECYIPTKGGTFRFCCEADLKASSSPIEITKAAIKWILEDSDLELLGPYEAPEGEVVLKMQDCAITPPKGYNLTPKYIGMNFSRVALFPKSVLRASHIASGISFGGLSVWKSRDEKITGRNRAHRLKRFAIRSILEQNPVEYPSEEAIDNFDGETKILVGEPENNIRVEIYTQTQSVAVAHSQEHSTITEGWYNIDWWFLDEDGTVFYISAGASNFVPEEEMRQVLEQTFNSWRRLSKPTEDPKPEKKGGKKWWKFWG